MMSARGVELVDRLRALRRPAPGSARRRRTCRTRRPPSRTTARAWRPAGRSGRSRSRQASCRRARCRRSASGPTRRRRGTRGPGERSGQSASARASVCSAAATELDSGALTTTMPRLVAASTSTLSTPVPARPIDLEARRPLDQVGGELASPSGSRSRRTRRSARRARRPTCRARARRRSPRAGASTPESAIFSLTRTFGLPSVLATRQRRSGASAGLGEDPLGAPRRRRRARRRGRGREAPSRAR